jgi:SulP family sulfate permease
MLVTLLIVAGAAAWFGWSRPGIDGKTIITTVAGIPRNLPTPHLPRIQFWWIKQMSGSALAIAFLGLLEALAIAKSIANTTRQKLDYNRQCMAEGLANLTGGFFQCLPGSGSLTRSAINFQAGAVSRMSGIFAAGTVALVVVALAPYARYIPKAVLAGLLVITAARLVDWKRLKYAVRASRYDALLVAVTAFSAIFISVEFSILIGVALSILLFVPRADLLRFSELTVSSDRVVRERLPHDPVCTSLLLYDLEGELFFGAAPMLDELFDKLKSRAEQEKIRFIILRVKRARSPDVVCMERFEHFLRDMERNGVTVLLCGVRLGFAGGMERLRFQDWLPADRVFHEEQQVFSATLKAVHRVYELIGENTCEHCRRNEATGSELRELYYLV